MRILIIPPCSTRGIENAAIIASLLIAGNKYDVVFGGSAGSSIAMGVCSYGSNIEKYIDYICKSFDTSNFVVNMTGFPIIKGSNKRKILEKCISNLTNKSPECIIYCTDSRNGKTTFFSSKKKSKSFFPEIISSNSSLVDAILSSCTIPFLIDEHIKINGVRYIDASFSLDYPLEQIFDKYSSKSPLNIDIMLPRKFKHNYNLSKFKLMYRDISKNYEEVIISLSNNKSIEEIFSDFNIQICKSNGTNKIRVFCTEHNDRLFINGILSNLIFTIIKRTNEQVFNFIRNILHIDYRSMSIDQLNYHKVEKLVNCIIDGSEIEYHNGDHYNETYNILCETFKKNKN